MNKDYLTTLKADLTASNSAINEQDYTISFIALSKNNIHLMDLFGSKFYRSVDTAGITWKAESLYLDHDASFENAIGKIKAVKMENGDIKVIVAFSKDIEKSREAFLKYKEGFSASVSVGLADIEFDESEIDGKPHYHIKKATAYELSAVWRGADPNARIAKYAATGASTTNTLKDTKITLKENDMPTVLNESVQTRDEVKEIATLGKIAGNEAAALEAIASGKSYAEFSQSLLKNTKLDQARPKSAAQDTSHALADYARAVAMGGGTFDLKAGTNGYILNDDFFSRFDEPITSASDGAKGLIPSTYRSDLFMHAVINGSNLLKRTERLLNLNGAQEIPIDNTEFAAEWVDEGKGSTASTLKTLTKSLRPKTLRAKIKITRTMLSMTPLALEAYIVKKMKEAMRKSLESALLYGNGSSIKGIFTEDGVNVVSGFFGAPSYAKALEFKKALGAQGYLDNLIFAGNLTTQTLLQSTHKDAKNTVSDYLINEAGDRLAGVEFELAAGLKDNNIILGDFKKVIFGQWGTALEVQATKDEDGNITFTGFEDCDILVARPQAFAIARD